MHQKQRGAAAVEFALVLPILLTLVLGIMEFGFFIFLNASAAGAAREGARDMAIHQDQTQATALATSAFTNTTGRAPSTVTVPASCSAGTPVTVTVELTYTALTRFFGSSFTASGTGEMRCGG